MLPAERLSRELPVLPRWSQGTYNSVVRGLQSKKSIPRVAKKFGLSERDVRAIRQREIRRLRWDEQRQLREIGESFGLTRERVRQIAPDFNMKKEDFLLLQWIKQHNLRIKDPAELKRFMEKNYFRNYRVLARALGIKENAESAVGFLRERLAASKDAYKERRRHNKEKIRRWAEKVKKTHPERLSYGHLFKNRRKLLHRILGAYCRDKSEIQNNSSRIFQRFLADVGVSMEQAGMNKPNTSKKQAKGKILQRANWPLPVRYASYYYPPEDAAKEEKARGKRGLGSHGIIPGSLRELVAKGQLVKSQIGSRDYYFRPGREERMQAMRRRAVRFALGRKERGLNTSITFGKAEARELVLLRLGEKPMTMTGIGEIRIGKRESLRTNIDSIKKALEELLREGKIERQEIGGVTYYFLGEQKFAAPKAKGRPAAREPAPLQPQKKAVAPRTKERAAGGEPESLPQKKVREPVPKTGPAITRRFEELMRPVAGSDETAIGQLEALRERRREIGSLLVESRGKLADKELRVLQREKARLIQQIDEITAQLRKSGLPEKEWHT